MDQKFPEGYERLMQLTNPTGGLHSATPWAKDGEHDVTAAGETIAQFRHTEDRDVALYFTNCHAGMIALVRSLGQGFDAVAQMTGDDALKKFAGRHGELCRIYADLFSRLGQPEGGKQ